jgi:hypothetical protein
MKAVMNIFEPMITDLRKKENLHVVFWLLKDFAWLSDIKWLGMGMAVPTVLLSVWLTMKSRGNRIDFFHNIAVSFWITGNSMWMAGEFYFNDSIRHLVKPLFLIGFVFVGYYYVSEWWRSRRIN